MVRSGGQDGKGGVSLWRNADASPEGIGLTPPTWEESGRAIEAEWHRGDDREGHGMLREGVSSG